ncbi:hypothetical protein [Streptomyces sp. NRRL S-1448]|nr:hypothetical protein [Streptomyces sp. NRRL S-1448]
MPGVVCRSSGPEFVLGLLVPLELAEGDGLAVGDLPGVYFR